MQYVPAEGSQEFALGSSTRRKLCLIVAVHVLKNAFSHSDCATDRDRIDRFGAATFATSGGVPFGSDPALGRLAREPVARPNQPLACRCAGPGCHMAKGLSLY